MIEHTNKRLMLHLRARLLQNPSKGQFDILHQMTRKFDMSNIRRVIQRPDIVVFQNPGGVEVVHETLSAALVERTVIEGPHDILDGVYEATALRPRIAYLREAGPEGDNDDLGGWPATVDLVDKLDVAVVELGGCDVIRCVIIVGPNVDDSDVRRRMRRKVPGRDIRSVAVDVQSAAACIGYLEPLVRLTVQVPVAATLV